jgi:hypothetical protein
MKTRAFWGGLAAAFLLCAPVAHAADTTAAIQLYDEAEKLTKAGNDAAACPKFAESQRLDPQLGTLLHLAACYEKIGRTASAWGGFADAADLAAKMSDPREKIARQRAAALLPKLSKLTITVSGAAPSGLEIQRDGAPIGSVQWGSPVATDPGKHTVTAAAPGKKTWSTVVDVPANAASIAISVPPLEEEPVASTSGAPARGWQRPTGLIVGGAGIVTMAVGGVLGLRAKSTYDDSSSHCDASGCDPSGMATRHDAVDQGNTATIVAGVGAAVTAVGAVLWLTAPSRGARGSTVGAVAERTHVALGPRGLVLGGEW